MYHESTNCGMVTLTLTMLVSVLPSVLPSGSVPSGVTNSTINYLLNSTTPHNVSTTPSSELMTSGSISKNSTLAVLLSNISSAVSTNLTTTTATPIQSSTSSLSSTSQSSSSQVTSSYALLTSLSSPPSPSNSSSSTVTLTQSQESYNSTSPLTQTSNASISTTQKQLTQSTTTPSASADARSSQSTQAQLELQIVLVKKLLQKWGYMPVKKNGCWVFTDWRKEDPRPVTCATTPSTTTTAMPSTPVTYESISELATSDFSLSNTQRAVEDETLFGLSVEEREKFYNGIIIFQETFHLPVTGRLDSPTAQIMKQRICGVPDRLKLNAKDFVNYSSSESPHTSNEYRTSDVTTAATTSRQTTSTLLSTILRGSTATPRVQGSYLPSTTPPEYDAATDLASAITEIEYSFTEIVTETSSEVNNISGVQEDTPFFRDSNRTLTVGSGESVAGKGTPSADTSRRRRRGLSGYLPNVLRPRLKRTASAITSSNCLSFSTSTDVTWRIVKKNPSDSNTDPLSDSTDFTRTTLRGNISEAFRRWSEVSKLKFTEKPTGSTYAINILLQFVTDGSSTINFTGNEMAYSTIVSSVARIYFKDSSANPWAYRSTSSSTRDLLTVAVHEIGHVLCLDHDSSSGSVMTPNYNAPSSSFKVIIDETSRSDMKELYGACDERFTAFDWVRWVNGYKRYSTFLYRGDHYWIWENSNQRTRYGDPRQLNGYNTEWNGVPSNLQAIVHVLPRNSNTNKLYFFANGRSYLYHQTSKYIISDSPISTAWSAKSGTSTAIPSNIKAAYFDKTDGNVYFFNESHVFAYDMTSGQEGCCLPGYPKSISSAYPGENSYTSALENGIDGAYYSISDHKLYFFKANSYWESTYNPSLNSAVGGANVKVKAKQSNKHEKWKYVCEV